MLVKIHLSQDVHLSWLWLNNQARKGAASSFDAKSWFITLFFSSG